MKAVPNRIKDLIKQHRIIFSGKARDQLTTGRFDTADLLNSIWHGHVIKKEKDEQKRAQYKYTSVGPACCGEPLYSCGKMVTLLEKTYFIITFHETR